MFRRDRFACAFVLVACLLSGCDDGRPEIAPVTGAVTLDGAPLPGATVVFTPRDPGLKPSRAVTNDAGRYELTYLRDIKGAVVGTHEVRITTRTEHKPVERLPARYHSDTEIEAEVSPDGGEINFDLKSS